MKEKKSKVEAENSRDSKKKNKDKTEISEGKATRTEPKAIKHEEKEKRSGAKAGKPDAKAGRSDNKRGPWFEYFSLFWEFFKIGLFTIGGGMAMIPQIQQVAVKDKGWLTEEEMIDCVAISQSMPGVIAINSATYIGKRIKGIGGCLAATIGVIMPSFMIIIIVVTFLGAIGENKYILGAFTGVKAAVCGLIIVTAVRLGRQSLTSVFQWVLAIASLLAIGFFGITAIWAILAGAVAGIIYNFIKLRKTEAGADGTAEPADAVKDSGFAEEPHFVKNMGSTNGTEAEKDVSFVKESDADACDEKQESNGEVKK